MSLPSGEIEAPQAGLLDNCTGSPPSNGTFQRVPVPDRAELKTTHLPSREIRGLSSNVPLVSCLTLPPSISITQMFMPPERFETNAIKRPSGETLAKAFVYPSLVSFCFPLPSPFIIQISLPSGVGSI